MAYKGKFIDRNPKIISAGKSFTDLKSVRSCLNIVSVEDVVTALKYDARIDDKPKVNYPEQKVMDLRYSEMKHILQPPVKSPFQHLMEELRETMYSTHWKKSLGKSSDPTPNLPQGLDTVRTTFGKSTKSSMTAREAVNPDKLPRQVLFESNLGHELYLKSHKDYHQGEQVDRDYYRPNFNPDSVFGIEYDSSGTGVKKAMKWINPDTYCLVSKQMADYTEHTRPKVGRVHEWNHVLDDLVPKGHTFGLAKIRPFFGVSELLKECEPSVEKREQLEYMQHANLVRASLKKKSPTFPYLLFLKELKRKDIEKTEWLPLTTVYGVCKEFAIQLDKKLLEEILIVTAILNECGLVNYQKFYEFINWKFDFPVLKKIHDVPREHLHYDTSSNPEVVDRGKPDKSRMRTAGLPSKRFDLPLPQALFKGDRESLGDETSMHAVISPSIYTQYGVSHRDFFLPRQEQDIRQIFSNIGLRLSDEVFQALWQEAYQQDKTGGVCIETFRNILDQLAGQVYTS